MAVNMEVVDSSKGVDGTLSTTDSIEFNNDTQGGSDVTKQTELSPPYFENASTTDEKSAADHTHMQTTTNSEFCIRNRTLKNEAEERSELLESQVQHSSKKEDASEEENKTELVKKKLESSNDVVSQAPLAFTIDFGSNKEIDTARYQNLFEKYNARHKRHLSMSKVEINPKKSGALLSPNLIQSQKIPSTHSEGYFSSEDETKRKTDQLSERFKQLGSKCFAKSHNTLKKSKDISDVKSSTFHRKDDLMTRSCDDQMKHNKFSRESLSLELDYTTKLNPKLCWAMQKSATINDLSHIQASNYDDENEKLYTKNIQYIDTNYENKKENTEQSHKDLNEKVDNMDCVPSDHNLRSTSAKTCNLSSVSYTMELNADEALDTNLDVFNVSNTDVGSDEAVSEAGTYTVHKDYTDEEKARMDIDKIFSVGVLTEDESNEAYVHSFKMSISRDNNTWISEWATQVAQHNSLPPAIGGATGRTPPLSPSKIPSPIHSRPQRLSRNRQDQSDSSLDAESYMKIKEKIGLMSNQYTLIDSGGESDDDTSNSYNTPPHSSQRTPVHSAVTRRSSLSESLFRRININENRRSVRKYFNPAKSKTEEGGIDSLQSPSHVSTSSHLTRRSSSLDRKEYTSDTTESNTSRRNSMKYGTEDGIKHTNSPVLNRLRPSTPKLTNSPIVVRKTSSTKMVNSPTLEKTKHLTKSSPQAKNVGYFTCVENSPYMLRKSNSTTSYHEGAILHSNKEVAARTNAALQNSPELQRNLNIQRSSSNASIKNLKSQSISSRHSSLNSSDVDRASTRGRFLVASDSSSETGEQQPKASALTLSSGIKLNRAFSIRRARLTCESDTTPNTTPEGRRKKAQTDVKSSTPSNKHQNFHRNRTSSTGVHNKESVKKTESSKPRVSSVSRTDSGRLSTRTQKTYYAQPTPRSNQKSAKEHKKSGRSNSTLTSKEVEFQNWKRRKSYDPMKAAAEGRKKLIDGSKKHHSVEDSTGNPDNSVLRSASFHGTGGALSLANEWSDNELDLPEEKQAPPPSSPQLESDSDLETSSYLQTTQNVVSAMSARITVYRPSQIDSDNESDEDTSHSLYQNISKVKRQPSDTESSDEQHLLVQSSISNIKYRTQGLRRARLEQQSIKAAASCLTKMKASYDARKKAELAAGIGRTDTTRYSVRFNRPTTFNPKTKPKDVKKSMPPNAREVEMQNWKRRKSYDPMKAAMEGKRKAGLAKRNTNANLSPRTDSDR